MKAIKKIGIIIFLLIPAFPALCQDINFSQFYELPLLRNPALAGIFSGDFRITSSYRNQWESVTVPYRTMALGAEYKLPQSESSVSSKVIGMQVTNDVAGDSRLSRTQVFPAGNIQLPIGFGNQTYLSMGFMGGPVLQKFDPSKLTFDDQFVNGSYSPANPTRQVFSKTSLTYFDMAAGVSISGMLGQETKYYVGLGGFHLIAPKVAFLKQNDVVLNRKFVVNAGIYAPTSIDNRFIIYADYFTQGGYHQFQGGFLFSHNLYGDEGDINSSSITGGAFYRWDDALIPVIKMDLNKLGIGISYDINTSKLKAASQLRGGFELTLSYKDLLSSRHPDPTSCPVVF